MRRALTLASSNVSTREGGFTYLGVLVAVAVLSAGLAGIGQVWSTTAQRQRERELEWIGQQYVQAIASYYHSSPAGAKKFPSSLEALLSDTRFPFVKRHLRRIYVDPFTGKSEWGLIRHTDGAVIGIYSMRGSPNFTPAKVFKYTPPAP